MVNIAVFASGSGTNFETILSHIEDGSLHVNCACLIVDKECVRKSSCAQSWN